MRVARHIVDARRRRLAELLQRHRYLEIAELCREFSVSEATMRRDLAHLEKDQLVTRTYGGALGDFNQRFPSFRQRRNVGTAGKQLIAQRALGLVRPEMTVFLDAGTTVFALTEALRMAPVRPLTCVTCSLPVADLLSEVHGLAVHLLGGQVLHRQSVLLGEAASRNAGHWNFDLAFLSAEGMTRDGLWNSQPSVVALQRVVASRSKCVVAMLDSTKLGHTTQQFLGGWDMLTGLLTDALPEAIAAEGIPTDKLDVEHIVSQAALKTSEDAVKKKIMDEKEESDKNDLTMPTSLL